MEELFDKLLKYYNLTLQDYDYMTRNLSFDDVKDPFTFNGMKEAINICKESIKNDEKIIVYGDYDCDGIMSTSIITKAFLKLNKKIDYYVPSRYLDGYGLSLSKAQTLVDKHYDLVILCDNGISALEASKLLKDNNIKVIIIDHHLVADKLPNADAIIHPSVSNFSSITTSAGFCSFMFSYALLGSIDPYLLILGAISVISDMMPLKDFNRDIVRLATSTYKEHTYLSLDLLKENDNFDYLSMSMKIAPKINAVGRLLKTNRINDLIKYFISDDKETILKIYQMIEICNENRKSISADIDINLDDINDDVIISIYDIEEGMIGLLANKILNTYHKPTIILTYDSNDNNILKGSMRASDNYDVVDILKKCDDLLENYGGHTFAGGLTLKKENFDKFKVKINEICKTIPKVEQKIKAIDININDINLINCRLIDTFSPFGEDFKAPILKLEHVKTSSLTLSRNKKHIVTNISLNSQIVGFNIDVSNFNEHTFIDLYGTMALHTFYNKISVQFLIDKYFLSNGG